MVFKSPQDTQDKYQKEKKMSNLRKNLAQNRFHLASNPKNPRPTMRKINWAILRNERDKEKNKKEDTQESFIGKFDSLGKKMGKIARRIGRMG